MDPVTGVGLAASVIQLVLFSIESVKTVREIYERGSIGRNGDTAYIANHLTDLTRSLQQSLQSSSKSSALSKDERDLLDLSRQCEECAQKLQRELGKLQSQPRSSVSAAIRITARAVWMKRKIEEISKRLEAYRSTLETSLLHRLSQRFELQRLRNDECFMSLDTSLQHVIVCLVESCTSLAAFTVQESDQTRAHITYQIERLKNIRLEDRYYDEVVKSLFYPDIFSRQEQVDHDFDGIEDSYEWIFQERQTGYAYNWDNFTQWLKSGHGSYWINGKAGSGKSTLMSYICQNNRRLKLLKQWSIDRRLLTPTYFFWAAGTKQQRTVEGLLRSLIYQMLVECHELVNCLQSGFPIAVCMFIDGLDEIDGDYHGFLRLVDKLANQENVKICLSSRPLLVFEEAFSSAPSLKLQDLTYDSIRAYAETQLSDLIQRRVDKRDIHRVKNLVGVIVNRANGVFLWAVIAIRDVRDGVRDIVDLDELAQTVDNLPPQLESLFMLMLNRIKPAYQRDAARFLQIALYMPLGESRIHAGSSPLTLCILYFIHRQINSGDAPIVHDEVATSEIDQACETLRTRLLSHTAGLLDIASRNDGACRLHNTKEPLLHSRINFLHRTARDFVHKNDQAKLFLAHSGYTEAEVHILIARGMLSHLVQFWEELPVGFALYGYVHDYHDFERASQHIALAEKLTGAAQHGLVQSLDYDLYVRKGARPWVREAFLLDGDASVVDVVGMAAAVGMTLYICDRLNIPHASRRNDKGRSYLGQINLDRSNPATMVWSEPRSLKDSGESSAFLRPGSNYRQTLCQFLQVQSAAANPQKCQQWASDAFAETYLLACCRPSCHDLVQILLQAGANPMVRVTSHPRVEKLWRDCGPSHSFWQEWLMFLRELRNEKMLATQRSGGCLLSGKDRRFGLTEKQVLDTTKSLLTSGVDVNQMMELGSSVDLECYIYLKRRGLNKFMNDGFDLIIEATAMFILEECFSEDPEFCTIANALSSSTKRPTRRLIKIVPPLDKRNTNNQYILPLRAEDCGTLWPLIEKWESSGHDRDLQALVSTIERMWRDNPDRIVLNEADDDPSSSDEDDADPSSSDEDGDDPRSSDEDNDDPSSSDEDDDPSSS
ncbi:MAG: hypothetical protein Q9195_004992 [Heterodermia aff. obscurata]